MKVFSSEQAYDLGPCAVALGTFDGMHLGHQALIRTAISAAEEAGVCSAVFTFDGHPLQILQPEAAPEPLMDGESRRRFLADMGLDALVERPFTREFAALPPEKFIRNLTDTLHPVALVVGYNYTFGSRGAGTVDFLREMGREMGFRVIEIPPVEADGQPVSSTRIRQLLREGNTEAALRLLGRK